jgi:transcriptional regulator with XRE-family HTH domain
METQQPTAAPERFLRLVKKAMNREGLSVRQFAERTGVSPAYLSRLLNRERGAPSDDTIAKFEEVLDIDPRGSLFDAAGRHDEESAKFFRKPTARILMRTLGRLTEEELAQVRKVANDFAEKRPDGDK